MTNWLIHTFIKDYENIQDEQVRYSYGILTTIMGLVCNTFLCLLKVISGMMIHSVSIMSDGFNNLSDGLSCLITLIGFKVANKPADEEHPFGHGRMEYIVSFISCIIIFVVIYGLLKESITKLIHLEKIIFNNVLFVLLLASVLVKVWMCFYNKKLGEQLNNLAMKTASQDARNDAFATLLSIVAMVLACVYPNIPFDGAAGILLSFFLFYSAFGMAKEIVSAILGNPIDPEIAEEIKTEILSDPQIHGIHDLMLHEYGPNTMFGSAHCEMDSDISLMQAHEIVDEAERHILEKYHVQMSLHVDPLEKDTPRSLAYKKIIIDTLQHLDPKLSMHDLRLVPGKNHMNLFFDVIVPFKCKYKNAEIQKAVEDAFLSQPQHMHIHITFEHGFIGGNL